MPKDNANPKINDDYDFFNDNINIDKAANPN
jgi:hypothetical protein